MSDPNYWVCASITGDGSYVVVSDRDGGVMEAFDSEEAADARADELNASEASA